MNTKTSQAMALPADTARQLDCSTLQQHTVPFHPQILVFITSYPGLFTLFERTIGCLPESVKNER
jgi:hypothetical protein